MAEGDRGGGDGVAFARVAAFTCGVAFGDLPDDVVVQARRCLLDLIGVAAAGSTTKAAGIASAYAASQLRSSDREARILFDGRRAGIVGAAFAGALTIDALDAHDGHALTKGHAGVAILPALLALVDGASSGEPAAAIDGREFLTCLVIGYEIATRAGIALHSTVADYHCSGAWNALGSAAVAARLLGLDELRLRHALGIAEYFAPRGQILRVCEAPTMVKDGSACGAEVGVTAAMLAAGGFTGAPAVTIEGDDTRALWSDLGTRWRIREQYLKAYPVCRWAQPAVEAALALQRQHRFDAGDVAALTVESFREAVALGARCSLPRNTEEAQYSLRLPVAAALVYGEVGANEVSAPALDDPRVQRLQHAMTLVEDSEYSARFPAERWARVRIELADGRVLVSAPAIARGGPDNPLSDAELRDKYFALAGPVVGRERAERIAAAVDSLATERAALAALLERVLRAR